MFFEGQAGNIPDPLSLSSFKSAPFEARFVYRFKLLLDTLNFSSPCDIRRLFKTQSLDSFINCPTLPAGSCSRTRMPVCTENLNPGIVVMESTEDGERFDASGPLNRTRDRRIFVQ